MIEIPKGSQIKVTYYDTCYTHEVSGVEVFRQNYTYHDEKKKQFITVSNKGASEEESFTIVDSQTIRWDYIDRTTKKPYKFWLRRADAPSDVKTAPLPPSRLTAFASDGRIDLLWQPTPSSDRAQYNVYRANDENGHFVLIHTVPSTSHGMYGLENGRTYYFKVTAVLDGSAESIPTNVVAAKPRSEAQAPCGECEE